MWFKSECNQISERLWEYASQHLSASETAQIEGHLQQCARCQAEADACRQTVALLGAARRLPVPASRTTWQDLSPRLAPARRPALRSADLLPRLTLAGAGTALAATLLVVFLTGGHRSTLAGNPTAASLDRQPIASAGPKTPSAAAPNVAQDKTAHSEPDGAAFGPTLGSFYNGAVALLRTPNVNVARKPMPAPAPGLPTPHRRSYPRLARLDAARGHARPAAITADTAAQLDGGNVSPRTQQNYVLSPVSASTEDETAHRYVIGSIPVSQSGAGMVASSDGTEEGRAW